MSLTNISEREPLAYTVSDFCRAVGLGRSTVNNMIASGDLESVKIGYRRLIPYAEAVALLERNTVKRSGSV
jgi:excisionase family DNA binding protein